ncbi:hypothetical protein Acr_00g0084370 [Actinidia rufa]|uniref:Retrotransposon gag domain-containing protein n=1 Tax=Actinidia rufa TaxID=165716 RepID=A0A7J0DVT0_9ERIC|nr:hypothetical protein Acr_00g0084370 [Actinidia rufa]
MLRNILGIVIILLARCGQCPWNITCLYLIAHGEHGPTGGISGRTLITCHHATREVARNHLRELVGLVEHAGARRNHDEEDDGNHQESVMGGGVSAPGENVRGAPPTTLGGAEFMQGVFTAIEQVGDALQWWKTMEEVVAKKWEPFKKAFLDQYFTDTAKEALRMEFINLVQGSMTVAQYEAKFTSLSSAAAAIEETLNETRKSQNPKSQREGTSNQSEGRSSKKPKNFTTQQQYPARSSPATSVVSSGQTSQGGPIYFGCHQPGHRIVDCPLKGGSYQSIVHAEGEQSGSYGIATTHSVSSGLKGHSSIYISTDFISFQTTGCSSAGLEDAGTSLRYNISSGTIGDSWTAGATIGYLCCARLLSWGEIHDDKKRKILHLRNMIKNNLASR